MTGNEKIKMLLIHRFFYPDSPPYAIFLDDMRKLFSGQNLQVDVLSSQPSYKSGDKAKKIRFISRSIDGAKIYRLPVFRLKKLKIEKLLNFVWFPFLVFIFLLFGRKYQVITVSTAPPVILAFLVSIASKVRGSKLIYHCMDVHPEIGKISGDFKSGILFWILKWMDEFTCRTAARIVVLSSDMKSSLLNRGEDLAGKIEIINNYDLSGEKGTEKENYFGTTNIKRIIFAGNIGRFQYLDTFILALKQRERLNNFELVFLGEGAALTELKQLAEPLGSIVKFIPHQSVAIARKIIAEADMGIVSLRENVIDYAYPSKTMTYLSEGTPILVCVGKESELVRLVESHNIGVVIDPNDLDGVYEVFKKIAYGEIYYSKEHVKNIFEKTFSKERFNHKFSNLVGELIGDL
jgi:hypothetical protein